MIYPTEISATGKSCWQCKHYKTLYENGDEISTDFPHCVAFPNGIPEEVWENGHDKPRMDLGQSNTIVFEPDELKIRYWERQQVETQSSAVN